MIDNMIQVSGVCIINAAMICGAKFYPAHKNGIDNKEHPDCLELFTSDGKQWNLSGENATQTWHVLQDSAFPACLADTVYKS